MGIVQRDSLKIAIVTYLGAGIGYANKILLFPNFLNPEQVGLANILVTIAALYAQLSALGIANITLKFFPFFKDRKNAHNGFMFWSLAFVSLSFIVFTLAFLVFRQPLVNYYTQNSPLLADYYMYIIPLALAALYYTYFDNYLRSLFKTVVSSFVYEIFMRLAITLSITLYALGWVDFQQFIVIYILANSVPAFVLVVYTLYLRQFHFKPLFSKVTKRLLPIVVVYGLFTILNNISGLIISTVDALMVAGMVGLSETGVYTTVLFMTSIMLIPSRAIGKVSAPIVAEGWKKKNLSLLGDVYRKVSSVALVSGSLLFLLIWNNMDNFFDLMPPIYSTGIKVFLYVGIARLLDIYCGINAVIIVTSKKYRYDVIFTVVLLITTIFFNLWLIPIYGMDGAALATLISQTLFNGLRVLFVYIMFGLHFFRWVDLSVFALIILLMWLSFLMPYLGNWWIDIALRSALTAGLFLVPVLALKVSPDINAAIWRNLRKFGILK